MKFDVDTKKSSFGRDHARVQVAQGRGFLRADKNQVGRQSQDWEYTWPHHASISFANRQRDNRMRRRELLGAATMNVEGPLVARAEICGAEGFAHAWSFSAQALVTTVDLPT
jgi:hypothetical protein